MEFITSPKIISLLAIVILFLLSLWILWSPLRNILAYYRLQRILKKSGMACLTDIYINDGMEGSLYMEYLILHARGILLLSIKPYRGHIFAAEQIELWTQVIRHHSYKFNNPLTQLDADIQLLQSMLPEIKIESYVLFTPGSQFPKGKPQRVLELQEFREIAAALQQDDAQTALPLKLKEAWQHLAGQARPARQLRLGAFCEAGDLRRFFLGLMACSFSIAWFMYQVLLWGHTL